MHRKITYMVMGAAVGIILIGSVFAIDKSGAVNATDERPSQTPTMAASERSRQAGDHKPPLHHRQEERTGNADRRDAGGGRHRNAGKAHLGRSQRSGIHNRESGGRMVRT